ncbi:related to glomerulosclerosis protein Mpv17 [Cephalotrichum gorgonifer]|uniref:Related to glomerulosclerosis protein Mpv17 n=1 Tax=Cephalotrichum gorgonifer TaxID=2041049 RepID=A0AAE8N091_9PEZI|nr:related to glomerulosclerosis protein Mpv17 [Cephalotrichum gorgonifer]
MAWETTRRRLVRSVNSKYIYGRIPLLHTVVFLVQISLVVRLTTKFNAYYEERPVMTMMVTNAILGGMADTVAQLLSAINSSRSLKKGGLAKHDALAIEMHELDRKDGLLGHQFDSATRGLASPFDFERLIRFMAYGLGMAPVTFKWFRFLEWMFPITKTSAFAPALKRVIADQLLFSPCSIFIFFVVMTVAEGGGKRAVSNKLRDMYFTTLKTSYLVWPAVQIINFRLMPIQLQLPFVSCISIAWTAYLSLANAADGA